MTDQLLIRVDSELKRKLAKLATQEGKTATQIVRDLIEDYVKKRDMASYIDDLWGRIGRGLSSAGAGAEDVAKAIRENRKAKARHAGRR
jgi:predicted DNA-binding protein